MSTYRDFEGKFTETVQALLNGCAATVTCQCGVSYTVAALFKVLTAAQRARVLSYGQGAQHRLLGAYHSRAWPQQWAVDRGHPAPRPRPRLRTLLGFATAGGRGRESRPRRAEIAGPAGPCGEATEPTEAGGPAAFVPRAWPAPQCRPRSNLHWQIHRERHRVPVVLTGRSVVKSKYT